MCSIKKFIILVACTIVLTTICYANWGTTKWGGEQFGSGHWGVTSELPDTYWFSTYTETSDWAVAYGLDWTEPYNTEIP